MTSWLDRTELLLGHDAIKQLARAHVAVFGVGGVGGFAIEALARSGIGELTIVDSDVVDLTNLNRQIIATTETLGQAKVDVMAQRIRSINPNCRVRPHRCFFLPETTGEFDFRSFDYVVDAVDTVTAKLQLIEEAQRCGTPIVCSMGAANKLDPTAFTVADIYDTSACPLAKVIRKECRKRGIGHLKVVYSQEPAIKTSSSSADERPTPGSVAFVPPVAGLILASEVVKGIVAP